MVKRDGRVYLGPRYKTYGRVGKGKTLTAADGIAKVRYKEMFRELVDPNNKDGIKTSFHASGAINTAGDRIYRQS